MKKFYMLAASMMLATSAFAAEGDTYWYIRGEFNSYNPDYSNTWALMDDTDGDEGVFTGTFTVPAGEFSFNLMNAEGQIFCPMDADMDLTPMVVTFENNTFQGLSSLAWDDDEEGYYWSCPSWGGGMITVDVNANSNNPAITIYAIPEGGQDESDFNKDYKIYPLTADGETAVFWEAGNIDDMWYESGNAYIIDAEGNETTLVKNLSGQPGQITLVTDDPYGFIIDVTSLELAEGVYTVVIPAKYIQIVSDDWETWQYNPEIRYEIEVTAPADEIIYWYIRGKFNNYDPQYADEWALMDDVDGENGVYTGTFTVPAGEFSFNLLAPNGFVYIPSAIETVEVEFENNSYTGQADYAYDETEEAYYWTYPAWIGGQISVSIDANTGAVEIYAFPEGGQDESDFNKDYSINQNNADGQIEIFWEGNIDDMWYESGNAYIIDAEGNETTLVKNLSGQPGQITLVTDESFGLIIDVTSLDLPLGLYTIVIPAKYIQIVSDDWETWLYNPEITFNFNIDSSAISTIGSENGATSIFNLQGQKFNSVDKLNNGIYIINGKKVMIRK